FLSTPANRYARQHRNEPRSDLHLVHSERQQRSLWLLQRQLKICFTARILQANLCRRLPLESVIREKINRRAQIFWQRETGAGLKPRAVDGAAGGNESLE